MHSSSAIRVGFAVAVAVHVAGALLARTLFLGATPDPALTDTPPELPGQTTVVRLAGAAISPPQEPLPPVEEYTPPEMEVRATPRRVEIGRSTFLPAPTDVTEATPDELALAERIARAPAARIERRTEPHEETVPRLAAAPSPQPVPRRALLEPPSAQAALPSSAPQDQSVGRKAETLPELLENRPPVYPAQAVAARWQGTVLLRVHVASSGHAAEVEVLSSSGHGVLDAEAVRAVRTWRFLPATRQGRPVASAVRLPVRFTLE